MEHKWFEWLEINERQIKINVNEYEHDDIVIVLNIKIILTKNNLLLH